MADDEPKNNSDIDSESDEDVKKVVNSSSEDVSVDVATEEQTSVDKEANNKDSDHDDDDEDEVIIRRKKPQDDDADSDDSSDTSDSDDEDSDDEDKNKTKKAKLADDSDSGSGSDERVKTKKVGDADEEDDDDENSSEGKTKKSKSKGKDEDEEDDDDDDDIIDDDDEDQRDDRKDVPVYDFDIMMAKKKEENSRKRRRKNYDIINDNDDIIADIINQMRDAVEADNEANRNKTAALNKLKLLPFVIVQLRKVDLRDAFLDSDVLSVITDWLAPLPDRSLTHLTIRESLLKTLIDFNLYDVDRIKGSGIGKAVMYLYKHPKETKENKKRAKQLITSWSRPIFNLDSSFNSISREEREERDLQLMKQHRNSRGGDETSDEEAGQASTSAKKTKLDPTGPVAQKPGDKGWIPRARVPAPSMRDYVVRPQSKAEGEVSKSSKRPSNMLEKMMRTQQERKRANKQQRAVNMKIDRL